MAAPHDDALRVAAVEPRVEPRQVVALRGRGQQQVQRAFAQLLDHLPRLQPRDHVDARPGRVPREAGEDARQDLPQRPAHRDAHPQLDIPPLADRGKGLHRAIRLVLQQPGVAEELVSLPGQPHAARAAFEQGRAQFVFQRANALGQARLRHVAPPRRGVDAALVGHGKEMGQSPQFHFGFSSACYSTLL